MPKPPWMTPRLERAVEAVAAAARVTQFVSSRLTREDQRTKADASPVTVADLAAQAVISLRLDKPTPLVGEESAAMLRGESGTALRAAVLRAVQQVEPAAKVDDVLAAIDRGKHDARGPRWWTLDPIDGTKGFLRGMQYAIALAHVEGGQVTEAVMACPHLGATPDYNTPRPPGRLFAAKREAGAWEMVQTGAPQRCKASLWKPPEVRVAVSYEAAHGRTDVLPARLRRQGLTYQGIRVDSQAKYALLAVGAVDAYVRIPRTTTYRENIWDHAAGYLIGVEAGTTVTDLDGKPLEWTQGRRLEANRGILAAPPPLHAQLVKCFGADTPPR